MKGWEMNELMEVLPDQRIMYGINYCNDEIPLLRRPDKGLRSIGTDKRMESESQVGGVGLESQVGVVGLGCESQEDCDFSDIVLKYITQILMEEDLEEKRYLEEKQPAALLAAEKSLYEAIGEIHPVVLEHDRFVGGVSSSSCQVSGVSEYSSCSSGGSPEELLERGLNAEVAECQHPSYSLAASSTGSVSDSFAVPSVSTIEDHYALVEKQSARQCAEGRNHKTGFVPSNSNLFSSCVYNEPSHQSSKDVTVKGEENNEHGYQTLGSRSKKSVHPKDDHLEVERNSKMSATYNEAVLRSAMFDMVLLSDGNEHESALREAFLNKASKNAQQDVQAKGGKGRGKKSRSKRDFVDLRSMLTLCAQAVAANDQRGSMELLKQIRQHSSDKGDGMQRLAHYFANGLEARLAGSGTPFYYSVLQKNRSAADLLKAYQMYLAISPFRKISNFFANKTIMQVVENKTKIHIIDFGILFGFQWPCLIQRLSARPEGPPKIRITGIDFPQPGFKPAEKVDETGRRLANYAESFKVPFEYNGIAKDWETITVENLKLRGDEVLVVNCLFNMRNILDESVKVDSPRSAVMKLIRKANPDIFVQGVVNGTYNAPFFISRFRESVFHYSSLFDMLETNIPRDIPERLLLEKEIFGRELMNVVACEGADRTERPETYKQWTVRNLRAGFVPLPLNEEIMTMAKERVKSNYHKDFLIGEDGNWLIQGWKGRIIYALSSWTPAN